MAVEKLLFFLVVIGPALSSVSHSRDEFRDLDWLFSTEEGNNQQLERKQPLVCKTKECEIIAAEFRRGMNESVDPCDDFHEYMCGRWREVVTIPAHAASISRPQMFQEVVFSRIRGILETDPEPSDILPVRQAKKWFRSCMDIDTLNRRGIQPLESILVQTGGWPMAIDSEEWDEDGQTWQGIEEQYFHLTGSYIFYDIVPTWRGNLAIGKQSIPLIEDLPEEYRDYSNNSYDIYKNIIEGVAQEFIEHSYANVSLKRLQKDIEDLTDFEKELNKLNNELYGYISATLGDIIEWYKTNMTDIEEVKEADQLDLLRLIQSTAGMVKYDVNDSTTINVESFSYLIALTKLMSETPKRTIVNYIHWNFISTMLPYTTEEIRDLIFLLKKNEFDVEERSPRWLECVEQMEMTTAASYAFVQKYYSENVGKAVREMIDNVRDEMKSQMENSPWIDTNTTKLAVEKLSDMRVFVGFPDWFKNKTRVVNAYKGLTIGNDYFDNILSFKKYKIKRRLRKLVENNDRAIDDAIADIEPTVVNAFYSPYMNSIELPAADFQPPFFTPKLPRNINYGIAGTVIGHEIGHGYDDSGIRYGPKGRESEISKYIMDMYYKRAECFSDQFNRYWGVTEADYEVSTPYYWERSIGYKTRGENIADTTGLHTVYEAYRKIMKTKPNGDYKLPGFEDFTDDQMFFMSFGSMWCEKSTEKYEEVRKNKDVHSPGRLRVIGAVSNVKDFARAFNCPKGKPMNPENKCNIFNAPEPEAEATTVKTRVARHHKMKKHYDLIVD